MNTYILNITVPAKNKKFYERVVLNLYPLVFHSERTIEDIFKTENVMKYIQNTIKKRILYEEGKVYVRDITDINTTNEYVLNLPDLISEDFMIFDDELF